MSNDGWNMILPRLMKEAVAPFVEISDITPLVGGVSSDIVKFSTTDGREYCAKRALTQLKVEEEWKVPIERNQYEIAWLKTANKIHMGSAPQVIAEDTELGIVILEFLSPHNHYHWKDRLLSGDISPEVGKNVGNILGIIHFSTLHNSAIEEKFSTDELFDALRLDPYLRYTVSLHPDLSENILSVLKNTAANKIALVHGDVSPKNILIRKSDGQPVLLDAECAWYGDPSFDAAFCLNHFLLKSIHNPENEAKLLKMAVGFAKSWLSHFDTSTRSNLEKRTALLLPCLLLARIDGKSPVEYLSAAARITTREISRQLLKNNHIKLDQVFLAFIHLHQEIKRKNNL